jgi:hypothetical protein
MPQKTTVSCWRKLDIWYRPSARPPRFRRNCRRLSPTRGRQRRRRGRRTERSNNAYETPARLNARRSPCEHRPPSRCTSGPARSSDGCGLAARRCKRLKIQPELPLDCGPALAGPRQPAHGRRRRVSPCLSPASLPVARRSRFGQNASHQDAGPGGSGRGGRLQSSPSCGIPHQSVRSRAGCARNSVH